MHTRFFSFMIPIAFVASGPALAQSVENIVVTAPNGLKDEQKRQWDDINKDAEKLASSLVKLRKEAADDVSDVAEAKRDLEKAHKKFRAEQKDMDRTKKNLAKAERDLRKLEARRAKLRAAAR
tara:strand:- start:86 stop:454 length:369 start_codon:yes stop_codon:yes gene_type:complete